MAQLSDDCFAFGGALMAVEEAQALILARIPPAIGEESVPLAEARGRVLAAPLMAPLPLPPFFNAAVDGWAFRHADLTPGAETSLTEVGRIAAGQDAPRALAAGETMRVFTGAPMPPGADTAVMQEDVRRDGAVIFIPPGLKPGANARPAGEDIAAGVLALPEGKRLGRFTLLALLAALPVEAHDLGILPDNRAATEAALHNAATSHDLLLTSGGVSTGEEDHVRAAIEAGGRLVFWRLAVKPGRPAAMGLVRGTPVLGLPGNPVAAVVTFLHLARPLVLRLAGALPEALPRFVAEADFTYRKKAGRREYVRVSLHATGGLPRAQKFAREGAGLLTSLTQSDAFVELGEGVTAVSPGDPVAVLPFGAVF